MEMIKCRTCLKLSNKNDCVDIEARCYLDQSIKQAILHLVPEMVLTIDDGDVVCRKCLRVLKICVKFIKTCLTAQTILAHKKELSDKSTEGMDANEIKMEIEEMEIIHQIYSDHDYHIKQEATDCSSISSNEDSEINIRCNETLLDSPIINTTDLGTSNNCTSSLHTLFQVPSLTVKSKSGEDIILEISDGSDKFETGQSTVVDPYNFYCSICSLGFLDDEKYKLHMEMHMLFCQYCGKTFTEETEYNIHVSQHKDILLKVCEFCGKILKGARSLRMHIAAIHEEPTTHICDRCPKSFKHKYKVNLHVKEVHEKARQQQCSVCGKLFRNSERCKSHYKLVHLKLKPYVCTICGNKYGRKDYLDKHQAEHSGLRQNRKPKSLRVPKHGVRLKNPGKPVICRVCNREIASVHLLKAHLESHVKIKRYKCNYCDLSFSVPNNKKRHEKLHESDSVNKFRCNICWKRMKTEEELNCHVNSHDRPPQYSCETCGEKFHRRYLLKNHIAEKHTSVEDIEKAIEEIVVKNLLEYADPKK